jgi:hypothetical protein
VAIRRVLPFISTRNYNSECSRIERCAKGDREIEKYKNKNKSEIGEEKDEVEVRDG